MRAIVRFSVRALVVLVTLCSTAGTLAAPFVVVEIRDLDRVQSALDTLEGFAGEMPGNDLPLLTRICLGIDDLSWIARGRSVQLIQPGPEPAADWQKQWLLVAPVKDPEEALEALSANFKSTRQDDDGIHLLTLEDDSVRYLKVDDETFVAGGNRESIVAFDYRELASMAELPDGGIAIDLDLEILAPVISKFLSGQKQSPLVTDPSGNTEPTARAIAFAAVNDHYVDTTAKLAAETSRVQFAFDLSAGFLKFRTRLLPRPGSTFGDLIQRQPSDFPELARVIDNNDSLIRLVGNTNLTEDFVGAVVDFYEKHYATKKQMMVSSGSSIAANAFGASEVAVDTNRRRMECADGEMAMAFSIGPMGFDLVQVTQLRKSRSCADLLGETQAMMTTIRGHEDRPLFDLNESAMVHRGVTALHFAVSPEALIDESDPELRAKMVKSLASTQPDNYMGRLENTLIATSGPNGEGRFKTAIDRYLDPMAKDGVDAGSFAPLVPAGGVYAALDSNRTVDFLIGPAGNPNLPERVAELRKQELGNVVAGLRADHRWLTLDVAVPLEIYELVALAYLGGQEDGPRAGLWPIPKTSGEPAATETEEEPAPEDGVTTVGKDGVSEPVLTTRIKPEFPERMRMARLLGKVILQMIIRSDGTADYDKTLGCRAKPMEDDGPYQDIPLDSEVCLDFSRSSIDAVVQWQFDPALMEGEPVDTYLTVVVEFSLGE